MIVNTVLIPCTKILFLKDYHPTSFFCTFSRVVFTYRSDAKTKPSPALASSRCLLCLAPYQPNETQDGACRYHSGFISKLEMVLLNSPKFLIKFSQFLQEIKSTLVKYNHEYFTYNLQSPIWFMCDQVCENRSYLDI